MRRSREYLFALPIVAATAVGMLMFVACGASSDGSGDNLGGVAGSGGSSNGTGGTGGTGTGDGGPFLDTGLSGDGELTPDSSCADITLQAAAVPLDMYFMVDTSGSMGGGGKMAALRDGLSSFLQDPQSVGLGASAQRFPIPKYADPDDESCDPNVYAKPAVSWATLPNPALVSWIKALDEGGWTPTIAALTGAVQACNARLAAVPTHKCAVVFVTDGKPQTRDENPDTRCLPTETAAEAPLGNIAAGAWAKGIPVFAIGFPGLEAIGKSVMATIAQKGGTTKPIFIEYGNVGQEFIAALADIRGTALGCEYQMPKAESGGVINPNLVKVTYLPGGAPTPETIPRVDNAGACTGNGWHYDNNNAPSKLIMCPATCTRLQSDDAGKVQVLLGCESNRA